MNCFLHVFFDICSITCVKTELFSYLFRLEIGEIQSLSANQKIIIIKPGQFIKRRKWWFDPPHQGRFVILTMMGRECSRLDPSYQRHITFACTACYQVPTTPPSPSRHYYPDLSSVPIYRPQKDG